MVGGIAGQYDNASQKREATVSGNGNTEAVKPQSYSELIENISKNGKAREIGDIYKDVIEKSDKSTLAMIKAMSPEERVFFKAGAEGLSPDAAATRADGVKIDQKSAWEAGEKGNAEFEKGNGEATELLIEATDYLDRTGESGYNILDVDDIHIGRSVGASAKNYPVKGKGSSRQHYKFAEGTDITDIEVIMGYGTKQPLADIHNIASSNGIKNPHTIQKLQGKGWIVEDGENRYVLLHWYRAYGEDGYYSFKVKEYLEE